MTTINAPIRKRFHLVFDVETTGLIPRTPRGSMAPLPITDYPYIIQLSCVVYDMFEKRVVRKLDSYIKIPDHIEIPLEVSEMTGIYKDDCVVKGRDMSRVLMDLYDAYMMCQGLVAHNMEFDENMILIEIERNRAYLEKNAPYCFTLFNNIYEKINNIERYCTMKNGTNICNIMVPSKSEGKPATKKWPKLKELHAHLFDGEVPENLHNSMVDVMACLKCYLKMRHSLMV
jgi:DNA polymerase III epsilon subunit-like protein